MTKNMKHGAAKILLLILIFYNFNIYQVKAADKIESVPLVNLKELSPTFEEDKDELESMDEQITDFNDTKNIINDKNDNDKVYINIKALDKITAKTSDIRLAIGEKKFFGPLEIKALKCQASKNDGFLDTVAYLQVKDLSNKDNNQVFIFNGWTFSSSPAINPFDHPVYDIWLTKCY
jgi:hypothetical protein